MSALAELQRSFVRAVLHRDESAIAPLVVSRGVALTTRLQVYRSNVRENFCNALAAGFPVLLRLVGEDYFRQMAWAYQQKCPSPSGNLFHTGERLAGFLARALADTEYAYLADVARLEWLCQESSVAADIRPLSLKRLGELSETTYERLKFRLHPSVRLMKSRFPVMRIWQTNQPEVGEAEQVDLDAGGDSLLIRCVGSDIELRRLAPGDFAFLDSLQAHRTLVEALSAAIQSDSDFALEMQLKTWVSLNVISDFHVL